MPLDKYGVLTGRPIHKVFGSGNKPHYQVHIIDDTTDWRIAVNVKSQASPSEVEYFIDEQFSHPILDELADLRQGFTPLQSRPGGLALDFIRANLFDRSLMHPLPFNVPGPDNDLNERVDHWIAQAIGDEDARVYAFGQRWGPEPDKKDKIFGFRPGNGIHDIHMNQGNAAQWANDDGVWQDGGMIVRLPSASRWVGIFLKFQSQTWHTDDRTGHRIAPGGVPGPVEPGIPPGPTEPLPGEPDFAVRIVAAMVNPVGPAPERETVTLLNTTASAINLGGWAIANREKQKLPLTGQIQPGQTLTFTMTQQVPLSNKGGVITLLNDQGLKVHGVSYTAGHARREGWTVVF